jgi:hypothetical protein
MPIPETTKAAKAMRDAIIAVMAREAGHARDLATAHFAAGEDVAIGWRKREMLIRSLIIDIEHIPLSEVCGG